MVYEHDIRILIEIQSRSGNGSKDGKSWPDSAVIFCFRDRRGAVSAASCPRERRNGACPCCLHRCARPEPQLRYPDTRGADGLDD